MSAYRFQEWAIPEYMMDGILCYIDDGIPPGDFLTVVIENNLMEAVGRADNTNIRNLPAYAAFFYNEAPSACHGSKEKMQKWIKAKTKERNAKIKGDTE